MNLVVRFTSVAVLLTLIGKYNITVVVVGNRCLSYYDGMASNTGRRVVMHTTPEYMDLFSKTSKTVV